ncbi:metallophosphoesterase [Rhizomonospora bruguierae]|uniref:metallophosphoesterase n=1 Tax=Rhizomonospora bruguierae TaxID=1581705 RepID=UPI001BD126AB|nr:metallophosphoesterase [Micromonospora sp. NBRC 107566]
MTRSGPALYAVSDVHGHRAQLREALREAGLVDGAGHWSGGDARLWFLGDYVDRGPDGIGVIDDVRALAREAAAAGGAVGALLGNHEVVMLAARRFGAADVPGWNRPGGFRTTRNRYGGRLRDMHALTPEHERWIEGLPAVAVVDGFLLVHADTPRYLEIGDTVEAVNRAVAADLTSPDAQRWRLLASRLNARAGFRAADPPGPDDAVARMLGAFGARVLVHGHSTLPGQFGVPPSQVREPLRYAGARVLAIDGGAYEGGRILVAELSSGGLEAGAVQGSPLG